MELRWSKVRRAHVAVKEDNAKCRDAHEYNKHQQRNSLIQSKFYKPERRWWWKRWRRRLRQESEGRIRRRS